jgi:flagellar hook-associated protein 1 FlgK
MGSLSGLFDMSRGALAADQAALNATANNVANQNTAGYTRQVASFSSGDTVTLSGLGGANGVRNISGPSVTTTSARDRVLEQRVQQQMQLQSSTSAQSGALAQIQDVFNVSGGSTTAGSTQIGTALDTFFSSLTALAGDPAGAATQQGVLSAAQNLASQFNSASTQLAQVGSSLNGDLSTSVTAVNSLTKTIAGLNRQIAEVSPNADAGPLEDQRQLAIEQLSQYVGLDQIRTENNGIALTTQGGAVLVSGATASALTATTTGGTTRIFDSSGTDVSAGIQGGSIGGQLTAQNLDLPAVTSALDALAYRVATAVNAQNQAGTTTTGAAGGAIFSVPATAAGAAATISVIPTSAGAIASAGTGEGESGNGNATALANLALTTDATGTTISGSLGVMLAQVGSSASSLSEQNTTQQATLTQLTTQRDSTSAVSLDTEAANLSQYQKSYQAAAQLLTVLDSLMATAINLGTQTAVS